MKREPDMDSAAYRDKKINEEYQQRINPKRPTEGQLLGESGDYLKDPETEIDTSQPLQSKSFEIDPDKETPTERQKEREDRLRQRAGSAQQGADIAKKKLPKSKLTDLPQFLQVHKDADPIIQQGIAEDMAENAAYDEAMRRAAGLTGRAKAAALKEANRLRTGDTGINPADIPDNALQAFNSFATAIAEDPLTAAEELVELKRSHMVGTGVALATDSPLLGTLAGGTYYAVEQLVDFLNGSLGRRVYATAGGGSLPVGKTSYDSIIAQSGLILKSVSKGADSGSPLRERVADAFEENKGLIGKKNIDSGISEVDRMAKVTKSRIKKYVDQFGGSNNDVSEIFQEQVVKSQSQLKSKAWLNKYFKDLTEGLGPDGLKNVRIQNIDGKPRLVDGRTKKTIDHAFEVDHLKAKEVMADLGLVGADMHENLDTVYSVFNQKKNHIGNPAIPDEIAEAVGQSTTLENFVRRRLDETFKLEGERVPQRFKEAAKVQMLDDAQHLKPNEKLKDVIEKRLKLYDKISNFMVQIDDYVPKKVQRQLDSIPNRDLNPQEYLQQLKDMGVYDRLTGRLKTLHNKLSDDWINLKRGLRSRPTTKYMQPGHDV